MKDTSSSEVSIIKAVLSGNKVLFDALVHRHLRSVYAVAYAQCRNHSDAEDISQEAFLKAYQSLDTLREPGRFEGWVTTIARNLARSMGRREGTRRAHEETLSVADQSDDTRIDQISSEDMGRVLQANIDKLDESSREVLLLHYFAGKSTQEIADALDISLSAVLKRLQRGRERLGERLLKFNKDTFAPETDMKKQARNIARAVGLCVPAWGMAASASAATASIGLKAAAIKFALAASIGGAIYVASSLVLMESEDPLDAVNEGAGTLVAVENVVTEESEVIATAEEEPPLLAQTEPQQPQVSDVPPVVSKSSPSNSIIGLNVEDSLNFKNFHIAEILAKLQEQHFPEAVIKIDLQAVGYPYYLDHSEPLNVPTTGLIPSPYVTDGVITYINVKNVSMYEALKVICKTLGLAMVSEPGFVWISTPELIEQESNWEPDSHFGDNEERLNELIDLEFGNVHLQDVVEILAEKYKIMIAWDYGMVKPKDPEQLNAELVMEEGRTFSVLHNTTVDKYLVSADAQNITLQEALKQALNPIGLEFLTAGSFVYVSSPKLIDLEKEHNLFGDPLESDKLAKILDQKVKFKIDHMGVREFINFITETFEINVMLDNRVFIEGSYERRQYELLHQDGGAGDKKLELLHPITHFPAETSTDGNVVSVNLKNVKVHHALKAMLRPLGLSYVVRGDFVWVSSPERIEAEFKLSDSDKSEIVQNREKKANKILDLPAGLVFEDTHIDHILEELIKNYDINIVVDQQVVTPPEYTDDLYTQYYGPAQSFIDDDHATPASDGMIQFLYMKNATLNDIFDVATRKLNLAYAVVDGEVIVSTPERIKNGNFSEDDLITVENMNAQLISKNLKEADGFRESTTTEEDKLITTRSEIKEGVVTNTRTEIEGNITITTIIETQGDKETTTKSVKKGNKVMEEHKSETEGGVLTYEKHVVTKIEKVIEGDLEISITTKTIKSSDEESDHVLVTKLVMRDGKKIERTQTLIIDGVVDNTRTSKL